MSIKRANINNYTLRLSVTSACNLNCAYCNPKRVVDSGILMSDEFILDIVKAGVVAGVKKISWTGGEPTVRPNFINLIKKARKLGIIKQSMTTNGIIYHKIGRQLKNAGITKVNISLDTLDKNVYKKMCGLDGLDLVKKSVEMATKLYSRTKVNCVVTTEDIDKIDEFVKYAETFKGKLIVRFLEIVPCGQIYDSDKSIFKKTFVSLKQIKAKLEKYGKLTTVEIKGDVPKSVYYKIKGLKGIYSINPNYSVGYHCDMSGCTKIRISPQGFVSNCTTQLKFVRDFRNKTLKERIALMKEIVDEKANRNYKGFQHKQKYYDFWRFGMIPKDLNKVQK